MFLVEWKYKPKKHRHLRFLLSSNRFHLVTCKCFLVRVSCRVPYTLDTTQLSMIQVFTIYYVMAIVIMN